MVHQSPTPSSVDTGYRLQPEPLQNPVISDAYFQRVVYWYLSPDIEKDVLPRLTKFGDEAVSGRVNVWIANAEKEEPYVKQYDAWGRRYPYDKLVTAEGWKRLGEWGANNGFVFPPSSHVGIGGKTNESQSRVIGL